MTDMTQETQNSSEHQPVKGPRIKKGLVVVNTGNGKGKTTAALGVLSPRRQLLHARFRRVQRSGRRLLLRGGLRAGLVPDLGVLLRGR